MNLSHLRSVVFLSYVTFQADFYLCLGLLLSPLSTKILSNKNAINHVITPSTKISKTSVIESVSSINDNSLLLALSSQKYDEDNDSEVNIESIASYLSKKKYNDDVLVRVIDANTVKLEKAGLISFSGIKTPTTNLPECTTYSPSYKLKQLLPPQTKVRVWLTDNDREGSSTKIRNGLIMRQKDGVLVNSRIIESGFAKPSSRGQEGMEHIAPGISEYFRLSYERAKDSGKGLYERCTVTENQVVVTTLSIDLQNPPANPGDIVGCSDFETYEDALKWYERYEPYFGDVAKLDRDRDGVPCPGLPHTKNQDRYRMKIPKRGDVLK